MCRQLQAGPVGAVHVLGYQQHRAAGSGPLHQPQRGVENPQPLQLGCGDRRRDPCPAEPGGQIGGQPAQLLQPARVLRCGRHGAHQLACQLLPHRERRLAADVDPGPDGHPAAGVVRAPGQLGDQPGLADAALAGHYGDLAVAVPGGRPGRGQRRQLPAPAEQPPCSAVWARAGRNRRPAQLGQHRPGGRPRRHAQLGAQPLGERPAGGQRPGPVTGGGQPSQQDAVRRLVQRGQRAAQPRPAHCRCGVAVGLGALSQPVQQAGVSCLVLRPSGPRPVLVQVGQQLTPALRDRQLVLTRGG